MERIDALEWLQGDEERYIYGAIIRERGLSLLESRLESRTHSHENSILLVKSLLESGAVKAEVAESCRKEPRYGKARVPRRANARANLYITIDPNNISKELLREFATLYPDEFSEEEPNVFRVLWGVWWG